MKILLLFSFLSISLITSGCCDKLSQQSVVFKTDTLYLTKYDTTTVQGKADIIFRYDTIYTTYPFTAKKDTIIRYIVNNRVKFDTLRFHYKFPEHDFFVRLSKEIDTLKQVNTEVITTIEKKPTLFDKLKEYFVYLIFVIIGFGIGKLLK